MSDAKITLSFVQSDTTDYSSFPTTAVTATLNADTSWPELVDAFVQFLRGTGFFIGSDWEADYIGHKELSEKAQSFLKEFEARRLTDSEGEVEYYADLGGRDTVTQPAGVNVRPKKKKKAKK